MAFTTSIYFPETFHRSAVCVFGGLICALSYTAPTTAATLAFETKLSKNQLVREWVSPFTGQVLLEGELGASNPQSLDVSLFIDNENIFQQEGIDFSENAGYSIPKEITQGSVIKVVAQAKGTQPLEDFTFNTRVSVDTPSLVFLEPENHSIGHVGLFYNDVVYEAHPVNLKRNSDNFVDIFTSQEISIPPYPGVHKNHTLGSFLGLATTTSEAELPWQGRTLIPIEEAEAESLVTWIENGDLDSKKALGRPYVDIFQSDFLSPAKQKGFIGGRYTAVGLIERAAEEAGINDGRGYIPNHYEAITIGQRVSVSGPLGCPECSVETQSTSQVVSMLSPALLYTGIVDGFPIDAWLQGWLEAMDFTLIDPDGNTLTHSVENGFTNHIPGALTFKSTFLSPPGSLGNTSSENCSTNPPEPGQGQEQQFIQFFLPERKPGKYTIQLKGLSPVARAVLGDSEDGLSVSLSDCIQNPPELPIPNPPTVDPPAKVPEPTSILGLMFFGILGWVVKRRSDINSKV